MADVKRIDVPIYPAKLILTSSVRAAWEYAEKYGPIPEEYKEQEGGITITPKPGIVIIGVDYEHNTPSIVAHEAVHAAWAILDQAQVHVDSENHEALTYLVTWIVEKWQKFQSY